MCKEEGFSNRHVCQTLPMVMSPLHSWFGGWLAVRLVAAVYSEARTKGVSHSASGLREAGHYSANIYSGPIRYTHTFQLMMMIGEYEDNHFNIK